MSIFASPVGTRSTFLHQTPSVPARSHEAPRPCSRGEWRNVADGQSAHADIGGGALDGIDSADRDIQTIANKVAHLILQQIDLGFVGCYNSDSARDAFGFCPKLFEEHDDGLDYSHFFSAEPGGTAFLLGRNRVLHIDERSRCKERTRNGEKTVERRSGRLEGIDRCRNRGSGPRSVSCPDGAAST